MDTHYYLRSRMLTMGSCTFGNLLILSYSPFWAIFGYLVLTNPLNFLINTKNRVIFRFYHPTNELVLLLALPQIVFYTNQINNADLQNPIDSLVQIQFVLFHF